MPAAEVAKHHLTAAVDPPIDRFTIVGCTDLSIEKTPANQNVKLEPRSK